MSVALKGAASYRLIMTPRFADSPRLEIDLPALAANWRALGARVPQAEAAAVLKADAYGLGVALAAPALAQAGCRSFFVAALEEGAALRAILGAGPRIFVFNGWRPSPLWASAALRPVLNSLAELKAAPQTGIASAALQLDSGMSRVGLSAAEIDALCADPSPLGRLKIEALITHLACSDEPAHPQNRAQAERFRFDRARLAAAAPTLAAAQISISATGGALTPELEPEQTLIRPGIGLHGLAPFDSAAGGIPVARLTASVVQIRAIPEGAAVGYGAAWRAERPTRVATCAIGYADGLPRTLAGRGFGGWFGGRFVPMIGRVSMDLTTFDATDSPALQPGDALELIGPRQTADQVAALAGTIGYEIMTGLGPRIRRESRNTGAEA